MKEDTNYIPYGDEWKNEIKKLTKDMLIEMLKEEFEKRKHIETLKRMLNKTEKNVSYILTDKTGQIQYTYPHNYGYLSKAVKHFLQEMQNTMDNSFSIN